MAYLAVSDPLNAPHANVLYLSGMAYVRSCVPLRDYLNEAYGCQEDRPRVLGDRCIGFYGRCRETADQSERDGQYTNAREYFYSCPKVLTMSKAYTSCDVRTRTRAHVTR